MLMSPPTPDLSREVNAILDAAMRDYGIPDNLHLARFLGVSRRSIMKWREGLLSPSSRALLPLLIQQHNLDVTRPRRRRKLLPDKTGG